MPRCPALAGQRRCPDPRHRKVCDLSRSGDGFFQRAINLHSLPYFPPERARAHAPDRGGREMMARTGSGLRAAAQLSRRAVIALPVTAVVSSVPRRAESETMSGGATLPQLSYSGTELAPVIVDRAYANFGVTVDLAG